MTVEHVIASPDFEGEDGVQKLEFCADHLGVLDALSAQRGLEQAQKETVIQTMLMGVVTFMGPAVFVQHGGCPVCVLEGTLERACDEVSMIGRKAN